MSFWRFEFGEISITLEIVNADTAKLITTAFSTLNLQPSESVDGLVLKVNTSNAGSWELVDKAGETQRVISTTGDLVYHLSDRIIFHVADKTRSGHCLHAASVAADGLAMVIPAESGSGKSSLTAWLVANGFKYLTDELICIDRHQLLSAVSRPIQIKTPGLAVIEALLVPGAQVHKGRFANAITAADLGGAMASQSPHEIGLILFPSYQSSSKFTLKKMSSAEAGMRLMSNHVNARNLQDHGFRAMMKLIRQTPCYSLEYGGFEHLPLNFNDDLRQLMSCSER